MEQVLQMLLEDSSFTATVNAANVPSAAVAALIFVKVTISLCSAFRQTLGFWKCSNGACIGQSDEAIWWLMIQACMATAE
jgi:hypothetical protein